MAFTDISPQGPEGLFTYTEMDELGAAPDQIRSAAVAVLKSESAFQEFYLIANNLCSETSE